MIPIYIYLEPVEHQCLRENIIFFIRNSCFNWLLGVQIGFRALCRRQDQHEGLLEVHAGHGRERADAATRGAGGHPDALGSQLHERLPRELGAEAL